MGGKSQRKGAAGERELAQILRGYGYSCDRGGALSFGEVPDLTGLPGIHIEVKRVERLNVCEAMEQSIRDSQRMTDGLPVLFHRRNRKPWLVTMRLADWMKLYGGTKVSQNWYKNTGGKFGESEDVSVLYPGQRTGDVLQGNCGGLRDPDMASE